MNMPVVDSKTNVLKGGAFLVDESSLASVFIPELFSEEQLMIKSMVQDFAEQELLPAREKIEALEGNISAEMLRKAGELGLLGAHMPEAYGGMELDMPTNTLICDILGPTGSWTVSWAAHTGIGMLPILYFGTDEQKENYLPRLISGELKAAYCLTEPSSGSDALAAKTRADLNEAGTHFVLNGQKMWITNAGFADLFIVFAQVDGDKFTGFIVERNSDGLSFGEEEKKLGIKGSSTRQVFLENVKVPAENMLGELGKGHLIAFNALNIGRYKLGALVMGGCKGSIRSAVQYANERIQFGKPISSFGAIQYKLAEQAIRHFALESAQYRVAGLLEDFKQTLLGDGRSFGEAKLMAAEEYAIECSILKIAGSEVLDYIVDETVQVHGGMGFSEETLAARAYRDSRINRIYEGTNEINRMLIVDMLFKRAMKGKLDIVGPAWEVQKELAGMPSMEKPEGAFGNEKKALKDFKKVVLMVAGAAAKMQMDGELNLKEEQEVLMNVADMIIDTFLAESMLLRIEKLSAMDKTPVSLDVYRAMLETFFMDATARLNKSATDALASFTEGDLLRTLLMGLKRFTKYPAVNVKNNRRLIASTLVEANDYCF
jgi:alkylation response protein AidB-like acyl-CoA dehydrogenase